jgi:hypothetical protein
VYDQHGVYSTESSKRADVEASGDRTTKGKEGRSVSGTIQGNSN